MSLFKYKNPETGEWQSASVIRGTPGKTAYEYAQDAGYTGTEAEFSENLAAEIPTKTSQLTNDSGFITGYTETDPTVPEWAKKAEKPKYVASEVEAVAYITQDLTEEQKSQARINIGAIDQKILEMALAQRTLV